MGDSNENSGANSFKLDSDVAAAFQDLGFKANDIARIAELMGTIKGAGGGVGAGVSAGLSGAGKGSRGR